MLCFFKCRFLKFSDFFEVLLLRCWCFLSDRLFSVHQTVPGCVLRRVFLCYSFLLFVRVSHAPILHLLIEFTAIV
jgi:hypothetical protein